MIIFISGSLGSGKTSTAKMLSEKITKGVLVDPDVFSHMMQSSLSFEEYLPHTNTLTVQTVRYLSSQGLNIVVPGAITKDHYVYLKEHLEDIWSDVKVVCLNPDIEVVLQGRGDRELSTWEMARVKHHYENGATSLQYADLIIDSTTIGIEEAVGKIMEDLSIT